ncbi:MAG: hypothetical protein AAFO69_08270, partial [Bacteroidota bacterium]
MKFQSIGTVLLSLAVIVLAYYTWPNTPLAADVKADKLVVYKADRKMELWADDQLVKSYTISLGGNPLGHKQVEGDSRTPE